MGGEGLPDGWEAKGRWLGAKGVKGGEWLAKGGELRRRRAGLAAAAAASSNGGDGGLR